MKHKVFSIFDSAAEAYLPPFCLPTVGMAVRIFTDCCNNEKHAFCGNPADYTLFELGFFDDGSALFDSSPGVKVVNGLEVMRSGEYEAELALHEVKL